MSVIPSMNDLEKPFRMMERELFKSDDFFGRSPFNQLVPHDFFSSPFGNPWEKFFGPLENTIRPLEQMTAAMNKLAVNELGKISSDDEKFQVNVDVQHFAPEEINVKVINGHVIVQGKHEEKQDEHGYVSRQFVRRYALPKGCLPDTVESKLSSDGVLTVTAPKVLAMPSIGERIVPIKHTGPVQKKLGSQELIRESK